MKPENFRDGLVWGLGATIGIALMLLLLWLAGLSLVSLIRNLQ